MPRSPSAFGRNGDLLKLLRSAQVRYRSTLQRRRRRPRTSSATTYRADRSSGVIAGLTIGLTGGLAVGLAAGPKFGPGFGFEAAVVFVFALACRTAS
jgi:predicted lipid-binding transport protein (Tim44 family)